MTPNGQRFEHYQRRRTVVAEGVRRAMIVACMRTRERFTTRTRFTTDDRPGWVDSLLVNSAEFSGCV